MTRNKYKSVYIKIYENNKTYVICDICGMKMGYAYWGRHNKKLHPENILPVLIPTVSSYQLKPPQKYCEICDNNYLSVYYENHKKSKYHINRSQLCTTIKSNKEYCEICDKNIEKLLWGNHIDSKRHKRLEKLYFTYLDDSLFI